MDKMKLNEWLQVVGLFGVIASLVFVGLEIQQSRQIAVADIYQQRAALVIQVQTSGYAPEQYRNTRNKALSGETLTPAEQNLMFSRLISWLSYWENNHFQYEIGMLSEEQWLSSRNALRGSVAFPEFEEYWARVRPTWRESFAQVVDEVYDEAKASQQF